MWGVKNTSKWKYHLAIWNSDSTIFLASLKKLLPSHEVFPNNINPKVVQIEQSRFTNISPFTSHNNLSCVRAQHCGGCPSPTISAMWSLCVWCCVVHWEKTSKQNVSKTIQSLLIYFYLYKVMRYKCNLVACINCIVVNQGFRVSIIQIICIGLLNTHWL